MMAGKNVKQKGYYAESFSILVKNKMALFSMAVIVLFVLAAVLAPLISPYNPNEQKLAERLLAPSAQHLFGTDELGRDILSRCIYGCRISISVGVVSQLIATVIGYFMGVCAGYFGRRVDAVLSFFIQVFSCFPFLLFAMALMFVLGSGLANLYISLGLLSWAGTARLIRGNVMQLKEQEYVQACKVDGGSDFRIIMRHLLPNCLSTIIVSITLGIPSAILSEASLSFVGLGVQSPTASWGGMIASAQPFIRTNTYYSLFPGLFIMVTVIAFNIFGDRLRDALDPRMHMA